jgi:hypothetical protein
MRAVILSLLILGVVSPASADNWLSREGNCGEWRGFWKVQRDQDGVFVGRIDYEHIGGPCAAATGQRIASEVRAVVAGHDFFASRPGTCIYHGLLREERVRGRGLCAGNFSETFALRFLRDEPDREGRPNIGDIISGVIGGITEEQRRERLRDDFLDDPRTHRRDDDLHEFRR